MRVVERNEIMIGSTRQNKDRSATSKNLCVRAFRLNSWFQEETHEKHNTTTTTKIWKLFHLSFFAELFPHSPPSIPILFIFMAEGMARNEGRAVRIEFTPTTNFIPSFRVHVFFSLRLRLKEIKMFQFLFCKFLMFCLRASANGSRKQQHSVVRATHTGKHNH